MQGVIEQNHENAKHLEVATTNVLDCWVDFVNLRGGNYACADASEASIGTPREDAMMRDFTINAMFYNVNTAQIEDYTERGVHDLHNRIIRTPVDSALTLRDDPLRALRAIRFASRLNFKLDDSLCNAIASPFIAEQLSKHITRERIGKELHGILAGKNPHVGLQLIEQFKLFPVVFQPPSGSGTIDTNAGRIAAEKAQILQT